MIITEALHSYFHRSRLIDWAFQVEEILEEPIVKRYIGGDAVWQKTFALTSVDKGRELKSPENLQDWLEAQNRRKNLPELSDGKRALQVDCLNTGYLYTSAGKPDRCQIQIRLTYYQGGNTR